MALKPWQEAGIGIAVSGGLIGIAHRGDFKNTFNFLEAAIQGNQYDALDGVASRGVAALASATPIDTGAAASSWDYKIERLPGRVTITWSNSDMSGDTPTVILLQYGHGTRNGGWVEGRDIINPTIAPIFDEIAEEAWGIITRG